VAGLQNQTLSDHGPGALAEVEGASSKLRRRFQPPPDLVGASEGLQRVPALAPKRGRQQWGPEDAGSVSVPAPDANASQTNRPPQSPAVPPGRLERAAEQNSPPASTGHLSPPSFQEERSQSSVYSRRTGEENETEEVSSLSTTPTPPGRGLRNRLCGRREEERVSKPRARAADSGEGSKPSPDG